MRFDCLCRIAVNRYGLPPLCGILLGSLLHRVPYLVQIALRPSCFLRAALALNNKERKREPSRTYDATADK